MLSQRAKVFLYRWFFSNLTGMRFGDWLALLRENDWKVDPVYIPRAAFVTMLSLMQAPSVALERLRHRRARARTEPISPIFVLGHWRSGTTLLHSLFACDCELVTPRMHDVLHPHLLLGFSPARIAMEWFLPNTRLVDAMKLGVSEPFEDEFALAIMCRRSPYLGWSFPSRREFYERHLTLDDPADAAAWKEAMRTLVRLMTLKYKRRAVLKSPAHTARLRHLVDLFPDAAFVHVHRQPAEVFRSTCRLLEVGIDGLRFARPHDGDPQDEVIDRYRRLYERYFEDQDRVPTGRLVEIAFEDLVREPIATMRTIYERLNLPNWGAVEIELASFVASQRSYQRNVLDPIDPALRDRLKRAWGMIYERWGYKLDA